MSNSRRARRHPGGDTVTVTTIAEETWRAAEQSGDVNAYLNGLGFDGVGEAMRAEAVSRDEFLRRMAGHPDLCQNASDPLVDTVLIMEPDALRQWWASAP